jgi:hypothetical protein
VLLGVNMQTSFMHPPFGFALFYLRSVAPAREYVDKVTGKTIAPITTGQIYWGAVPFVVIQCIMVGILIAFPQLVLSGLDRSTVDPDSVEIVIPPVEGQGQENGEQTAEEEAAEDQQEQDDLQKQFSK